MRSKRLSRADGFTLIEVMVALVILGAAVLGIQAVASGMLRRLGTNDRRATAMHLAEDRIATIRIDPNYPGIDSYAGTESSIAGSPGYTRVTSVRHVRDSTAAGITDYRNVSISVTAPGLSQSVTRIFSVAAP